MHIRLVLSFLFAALSAVSAQQILIQPYQDRDFALTFAWGDTFSISSTTGLTRNVTLVIRDAYQTDQNPTTIQVATGQISSSNTIARLYSQNRWDEDLCLVSVSTGTFRNASVGARDLVLEFEMPDDAEDPDPSRSYNLNPCDLYLKGIPMPDNLQSSKFLYLLGNDGNRGTPYSLFSSGTLPAIPASALDTPRITKFEKSSVSLDFGVSSVHDQLQWSPDGKYWRSFGISPAMREGGSYVIPTQGASRSFWRLVREERPRPVRLAPFSVTDGATHLGFVFGIYEDNGFTDLGTLGYDFRPEGKGIMNRLPPNPLLTGDTLHFDKAVVDFEWTEIPGPGETVVRLSFIGGLKENLYIRADPGNRDDGGSRSYEITRASWERYPFQSKFEKVTGRGSYGAYPAEAQALQTLEGRSGKIIIGAREWPISFSSDNSGNGPAISDGTPDSLSYQYQIAGENYALLDLTDSDGVSCRLRLVFNGTNLVMERPKIVFTALTESEKIFGQNELKGELRLEDVE